MPRYGIPCLFLVDIRPHQALSPNLSPGGTLLAKAFESKEPAMVKEVVDCVRQNTPDQQKVIQTSRVAIFVHDENDTGGAMNFAAVSSVENSGAGLR